MSTLRQKVGLTVLLVVPVVLVAGLLLVVTGVPALQAERANARVQAERAKAEQREAEARAVAFQGGANAGANPGANPGAKLVRPESLAGGFILIVQDKTNKSNADNPIYFASSMNNWNPGDPRFRMASRSDMRWQLIVEPRPGTEAIEFKFTRGSWEKAEVDAELKDLPNRTLPMVDVSMLQPGERPRIELVIERWADERPGGVRPDEPDAYKPLTVTGNVRRLQVPGGAGAGAGLKRDMLVWLPPGYDDPAYASKVYPVLYLMDGQNVFQKPEGVPGEWGADETAQKLVSGASAEPFIIVAVPSTPESRMQEYLPVPALEGVEPAGDAFVRWLVTQVKPRVDRAFRVDPRAERTAIGGSSLGAVIALHAATRRPDVFGMVLAESPSIRSGDETLWRTWESGVKAWPGRVILGVGDQEYGTDAAAAPKSAALVKAVEELRGRIIAAGVPEARVRLVVGKGDGHNEAAWARRFEGAARFLFPVSESDARK